jgi:hypothetical protein
MEALKVATFLKIPWHDFKASKGWAVKFRCLEGLVLCQRTTFVQKLPTDCLEILIAYKHHIINLHYKFDYHLGQIANTV